MKERKSKLKMNWEYCECGCHGHECGPYWLFNDLKGSFHLHLGHGWISPKLKTFTSFEAAEEYAAEHYNSSKDIERKRMFHEQTD